MMLLQTKRLMKLKKTAKMKRGKVLRDGSSTGMLAMEVGVILAWLELMDMAYTLVHSGLGMVWALDMVP